MGLVGEGVSELREFLRLHFGNWENDLPLAWRDVFEGTQTNFDTISENIEAPERVFPLPRSYGGDENRNLLRAFEKISPSDVRVILIGQDPYPDQNRATGQAFEDGSVTDLSDTTSPSLRRFVEAAVAEYPHHGRDQRDLNWLGIHDQLRLPSMAEMFDGLAAQGVLNINTAWTFTSKSRCDQNVHLQLWRPVIRHVIQSLLLRDANRVVLTLGAKAKNLFNSNNLLPEKFVHHYHPAARGNLWYSRPNPLAEVNRHLTELELKPVCWLPRLACNWQLEPN